MNGLAALYERLRCEAARHPAFAGRTLVFGGGAPGAGLVLVGEAPGGEEERQGAPFVGKAGENLNGFLRALRLTRDDVYITNVVKVRPRKASPKTGKFVNRPPNREELAFFARYLHDEINILSPKCVITLGNVALRAVTGDARARVGALHGRPMSRGPLRVFPLYHPASVIYNRALSAVYAGDLEALAAFLSLI